MAKYRIPDFRKLYPEASEEVIELLYVSERKMLYQEYDLKVERGMRAKDSDIVEYKPSREDSYDRLVEQNVQFCDSSISTEEKVLRKIQFEQLREAVKQLTEADQELIDLLFYQEKTEREVAAKYHVSQNAIHKRRKRILDKLRRLLKNF